MFLRILLFFLSAALLLSGLSCDRGPQGRLDIDVCADKKTADAIKDCAALFEKRHPRVTVVISSGAPLESRLRGGLPPDAFFAPAGCPLLMSTPYMDRLCDLTDAARRNGWLERLPETVRRCVTDEGGMRVAPVGIRRSARLWFVPDNLKRWGVAVPRTWDEFIAGAPRLREEGAAPLVIGSEEGMLLFFEAAALDSLGADRWEALWEGRLPPESAELHAFWERMKTVLEAAFNGNPGLPVADTAAELRAGRAAFAVGDDSFSEVSENVSPDTAAVTLNSADAPGTGAFFVFSFDAMALPRAAENASAAWAWLEWCFSPEGQAAFNQKRGAISVRSDADTAALEEPRRSTAMDYKKKRLVAGLARNTIANAGLAKELMPLIASFIQVRDTARIRKAFAALLEKYGAPHDHP